MTDYDGNNAKKNENHLVKDDISNGWSADETEKIRVRTNRDTGTFVGGIDCGLFV